MNSERRKFCSECGSLIVIFCKKCGFNNLVADKYCGGCGVTLAVRSEAAVEETREEPAACRYSAAEIKELTACRAEVKGGQIKKKDGTGAEQISQDTVNDMFNSRDEE